MSSFSNCSSAGMSHLQYDASQNSQQTKSLDLQNLELPGASESYYEAVFTRRHQSNKDSPSEVECFRVVKKIPGTLDIDEARSTRYLEYRLGQIRDLAKSNDEVKVWRQENVERCYHKWMRRILPMGKSKVLATVRNGSGEWENKQSGRNELIATMIERETGVKIVRKMVSSHIQVIDGYTGRAKHLAHGWRDERALLYMNWDKIIWDDKAQRIMPLDSRKLTGDPQYLPYEITNRSIVLSLPNTSTTKPDIAIEEMTFGLYASHSSSKDNNGIVHSYLAVSRAEGDEAVHMDELLESRDLYDKALSRSCQDVQEQVIFCEAALIIEPEYAKPGYGIGTIMRASIFCRHAMKRWCVITHGFIDWDDEICNERKEYFSKSSQGNNIIDTELHVSPGYWRDLLMRCSKQNEAANNSYNQAIRHGMFWSQMNDPPDSKPPGRNGAASQHIAAVLNAACFIQEIFQLDDRATGDIIYDSNNPQTHQRRVAVLFWKLKEQQTGKTGEWSWKQVLRLRSDDVRDGSVDRAHKGSRNDIGKQLIKHKKVRQNSTSHLADLPRLETLESRHTPNYLTHANTDNVHGDEDPEGEENKHCRKKRKLCTVDKQSLDKLSFSQAAGSQSKRDRYTQQKPAFADYMLYAQGVRQKPVKSEHDAFGIYRARESLEPKHSNQIRIYPFANPGFEFEISHSNPFLMSRDEILCEDGFRVRDSLESSYGYSKQDADLALTNRDQFNCSTRVICIEGNEGAENYKVRQEDDISVPSLSAPARWPTAHAIDSQHSRDHDEQQLILYQPQPRHLINLPLVAEHNIFQGTTSEYMNQTQCRADSQHDVADPKIGICPEEETICPSKQTLSQRSEPVFQSIRPQGNGQNEQSIWVSNHNTCTSHIMDGTETTTKDHDEEPKDDYVRGDSSTGMPSLTQSQTSIGCDFTEYQESRFGGIELDDMINGSKSDFDDLAFDQWTHPDSIERSYYQQHLIMPKIYQSETRPCHGNPDTNFKVMGIAGKEIAKFSGNRTTQSASLSNNLKPTSKSSEQQQTPGMHSSGQNKYHTTLAPYISDLLGVACWQSGCAETSGENSVNDIGIKDGEFTEISTFISECQEEGNATSTADASRLETFDTDDVVTWVTESAIPCNYALALSDVHEVPRAVAEISFEVSRCDETIDEDFVLLKNSLQDFNGNQPSIL